MAPVFSETETQRNVYLPGPAEWTHAWSGTTYYVDSSTKGMSITIDAPLGQPAVFYRSSLEDCDFESVFNPKYASYFFN